MSKLTEKQTESFYTFVYEMVTRGHCNDAFFASSQTLENKLTKLGLLEFVPAEIGVDFNTFEFNGSNIKMKAIVPNTGLELAVELFGSLESIRKSKAWQNRCWKCEGKGYIREYGHVQGGVCFECNGTGKNK